MLATKLRTLRPAATLAALFPAVLLFFAAYFLLGRIGFWTDDYWLNQRDPATGALPPLSGLTIDRGFFFRPLFYRIVPPLATLLWNVPPLAHLLSVLAHGFVVFLAWRLMRLLGAVRPAATASALLFMVYPGHFEAVFWLAALPTVLASALMLGLMLLIARLARSRATDPASRWRRAGGIAVFPLGAFAICCFNEQPAMGVLALPLLAACARPSDEPLSRAALRSVLPTFLAGSAVLLYVYLMASDVHRPAGARGSAEQFVALSDLGARTLHFLDVLWRRLVLRNFGRGSLSLGWAEFRASGVYGLALAVLLLATAAAWAVRWSRVLTSEPASETARRPGLLALTGAWVWIAGWLPILAITIYDPDSRTRYWPGIGAAFALAGLGSLGSRLQVAGIARPIIAPILIAALLASSLCMVGIQAAFRDRWNLDPEQGRELRAQLPEPAPLTFFVPLEIRTTGVRTGSPVFDSHFRSPWEFPWTAPKFIVSVYRRHDVRCGYWRRWTPRAPVAGGDETGLLYTDDLGTEYPRVERGWRVPWSRAAPFIIDEAGRVRLVTAVILTAEGTPDVTVPMPQATVHAPPPAPLIVRLPRA